MLYNAPMAGNVTQMKKRSVARRAVDWVVHLDEKDHSLVSQLLYLVPLVVWLFGMDFLGMTHFMDIEALKINHVLLCYYTVIVLLVREVVFGCWDRRTLIGAVVLGFMMFQAFNAGDYAIATALVFVFCGRNVPFRRIAWTCFVFLCALVVITVAASLLGVIVDPVVVREDATVRHMLGFIHPNTASLYAFFALCLWVYLRGRKFWLVDALAWCAVFAVLYLLTNCRTSVVLAAGIIVVALLLHVLPARVLRFPLFPVLGIGSIVVCFAAALALSIAYDPAVGWLNGLNSLLSQRLMYAHTAIAKFGIHGQAVNFDFVGGLIVDCGYMRMLLNFGYVYTALALVMATIVAFKAWKAGDWHLLAAIVFIAISGFSESCLYMLTFDPFILLAGGLFYEGCEAFQPAGRNDGSQATVRYRQSRPGNKVGKHARA